MGKRPGLTTKSAAAKPIKANSVSMSGCGGSGEKSVSIRKISNGYVVSESSWDGKGRYKSTETFTAKPPTVQVEPTKAARK